jgi:hypothetical protein
MNSNADEPESLRGQTWQNMGTSTSSSFSSSTRALRNFLDENFTRRIRGDLEGEDLLKVARLSIRTSIFDEI